MGDIVPLGMRERGVEVRGVFLPRGDCKGDERGGVKDELFVCVNTDDNNSPVVGRGEGMLLNDRVSHGEGVDRDLLDLTGEAFSFFLLFSSKSDSESDSE